MQIRWRSRGVRLTCLGLRGLFCSGLLSGVFCFDSRLRRIVNTCEFNLEIMSFGERERSGRCDLLQHVSLCFPPLFICSFNILPHTSELSVVRPCRIYGEILCGKASFFIRYAAQYGAVQQTRRGVKVLLACCATLCLHAGGTVGVTSALFGK